MYLAVAGNIGAGKSSLTQAVSDHFGFQTAFEQVEENPYLQDFYKDMPKWAFHVQVFFLNSRFAQLRRVVEQEATIIQDRSIYEDASIFAKNQWRLGWLSDRDYESYGQLFENMVGFVPPPKLLIYLRAEVPFLEKRIAKRGRGYEKSISHQYLQQLNELYEAFAAEYNKSELLVVDAAEFDFVNQPNQRAQLMEIFAQKFIETGVLPNK